MNLNDEQFLAKITSVIDANLHNEKFGVTELTEILRMSRSTLHRKIKISIKKSVSELIRESRLKRANELLIQKAGTVSEIAYNVGFGSVTYFDKCFHDYYGYTPGEACKKKDELLATVNNTTKKLPNNKKRIITIAASVVTFIVLAIVLVVHTKPFPAQQQEEKKSIAVLPFRNDSPDSSSAYINGLMESIISGLSNIEGLNVRSRTSVENYRSSNKSLNEIARELKVYYVVEGSGQKLGNEIIVHIQLLEAKSDQHLLSKNYKKEINELKDLFDLQSEIAYDIVSRIKMKIIFEDNVMIDSIRAKSQ